jgi:hypothetical protein
MQQMTTPSAELTPASSATTTSQPLASFDLKGLCPASRDGAKRQAFGDSVPAVSPGAVPDPAHGTPAYEEMLCSNKIFGFASQYATHTLMNGATPRPQSTNLHCFHDAHPFTWAPIIDGAVYCSWSCRKAHLIETQSYHNTLALQNLPTKARKQSGILTEIKPSPPRMCLNIFGGPLTIEQFRAMAADESCSMDILPECLVTTKVLEGLVKERIVYELRKKQSDTETFKTVFDLGRSNTASDARMDTAGCSSTNSSLYYELDKTLKGAERAKAPQGGTRGPLGALMTKKKNG